MKKLAVFVEGETEQLFVEWLILQLAGSRSLRYARCEVRGGAKAKRRIHTVEAGAAPDHADYYVIIFDCSGDGGVKSRLLELYSNLVSKDYQGIIALRDAPRRRETIPRLQAELPIGIPTTPVRVVFVLAIMEIEAWFLAEHTHFTKIKDTLTIELIRTSLGFDPSADNMRLRDRPSHDLNAAYELVSERYQKGRAAQRTIWTLDVARLYLEMTESEPEIKRLVEAIDTFFQSPA